MTELHEPDLAAAEIETAPESGSQTRTKQPSRGVVFAIVGVALFMTTLDLTIVATALPAIHKSLRASISWTGWTITIYGLSTVVALPIASNLANRVGRKRLLLGGVALFTLASLVCGFATDIYVLIVFRAVQALGGGAVQPAAAGLVADHFGASRDRGIALFGVVQPAGQVVGPIAGGLLVGYLTWRWIFFVNVPIGVVLLICTIRVIPESHGQRKAKTDIVGLMLIAVAVLSGIIGVTNLGDGNTAPYAPSFLVPELVAIVLLVSYLRHAKRSPSPFIPMKLLKGKGFAVMNWINFLHGAVTFGVVSLVPLYAVQRYHLAALNSGTLLSSRAVAMAIVSTFAALALRRTGYRMPMMIGFSVVALGTLLLSVAPRYGISPYLWLSAGAAVAGLGLGAVNPAASNAALHLDPEQVAAITGLRAMFINLGVIVAVSITTAILNRSADPGIAQAHVFWAAAAVVFVVMVPLITRVPERRGSW